MTKWIKVNGSQAKRPAEFDTTSSSVFVYQRRNIKRIEIENLDGTTGELWEYEERKLSHDEYAEVLKENEITKLQLAICELYEKLEG